MEWLLSASVATFSDTAGCQKLGQPEPDSYFSSELKSSAPQQRQRYRPLSWLFQYSPVNARSVPLRRVTSNCCEVSSLRHSSSVFAIFSAIVGSPVLSIRQALARLSSSPVR